MHDETESLRRQRLAEINAEPGSREALEAQYGEVWDTSNSETASRSWDSLHRMSSFDEVGRREGIAGIPAQSQTVLQFPGRLGQWLVAGPSRAVAPHAFGPLPPGLERTLAMWVLKTAPSGVRS